jgi:hypothetical protein
VPSRTSRQARHDWHCRAGDSEERKREHKGGVHARRLLLFIMARTTLSLPRRIVLRGDCCLCESAAVMTALPSRMTMCWPVSACS